MASRYDFTTLKNTLPPLPTGRGRGPVSVVSGGGGYYGGGGGGLGGAAPRGWHPASGGVPGVTDPTKTVLGDLGNIGGIISGITDQQLEALRKQYPTEYFATLQQLLLNTQKRAAGDISDLMPELQTRAAEGAIGGGYSGSAMENTKLLRDLGLTRYGVEQQALKDLGLIKAGTPTVNPYDPTGVIQALIDAQARADLYRAAPIPEEAYKRARDASRGAGGGGGGGGGPGVRPATLGGGGGGGGTVDDILKRYSGGIGGGGPPVFGRGTRVGPLPESDYEDSIKLWEQGGGGGGGGGGGMNDWDTDFGGGVNFGGGKSYYDDNLFSNDGGNYDEPGPVGGGGDYNYNWMNSPFDTGGGGGGSSDDDDWMF